MDEFDIIARYFAPLATAPGAFGLKDDAAAIAARPGFDLIVTTDQIAEGTDFFSHDPPALIARKALRVNLSDIAAKGAEPFGYLMNLTLPQADATWLKDFAAGLATDQENFAISLLGGDTAKGPLTIAITAFGYVRHDNMVRRDTARDGDAIYVTGSIGDSGGGLELLRKTTTAILVGDRNFLIDAYRLPKPPTRFGRSLSYFANAAVDVSDGLIADLGHVAAASHVRLKIDAEAIPRSEALRALWGDLPDAIIRAATAGDDYQIAFTAQPAREDEIRAAATNAGIAVTRIGTAKAGEGVDLRHEGKALTLPKPGYRHF